MVNWLKRLWLWFKELSHFWLSLVVLLPLISYAFLPTLEETRLRIAGLVLQLCGIGTVARGISQTRQLFGHPSIVESSLQWLRRFPSFRRHRDRDRHTARYTGARPALSLPG